MRLEVDVYTEVRGYFLHAHYTSKNNKLYGKYKLNITKKVLFEFYEFSSSQISAVVGIY